MATCETCKFWLTNKPLTLTNVVFGMCRASKMNHPKMRSGCGLRTRNDFGCVIHEPSVVTKDVADGAVVYGNPAKEGGL